MDETRARNVVERAYTTHLLVFGATPRWRRRPPSTLLRPLGFGNGLDGLAQPSPEAHAGRRGKHPTRRQA
jgi:hypothetical protein